MAKFVLFTLLFCAAQVAAQSPQEEWLLKRNRRSEDSDIAQAIRMCMEKMEDNEMMAAMYSREQMEAVCRAKAKWMAKVSGMTREDQQQKMDSMSPGARNYFSSLGTSQGQGQSEVNQGQIEVNQGQGQGQVHQGQVHQGQQLQDIGQGPKKLTLTDKSKMMEDGKEACMKRTKKMMTDMFTSDQMESVCGSEMKWVVKAEEARRRDPTMRSKVESMDMPVRNYFNSLGEDRRQKRQTRTTSKPRKEYRMLTAEERRDLHDAMNAMKRTPAGGNAGDAINAIKRTPAEGNAGDAINAIKRTPAEGNAGDAINAMKRTPAEGNAGNISEYYVFVLYHQTDVSPAAHFGPSFLGWHREFLIRFERALQRHNPSVMLPYWDSTLDDNLGDLANRSIMWTPEFMGNSQGQVVTGPFANWETLRPTYGRDGLWRAGGTWSNGSFYTNQAVDLIVGINNFRENTWHVNPFVETVHGEPHLWVGGPMGDIENSPSDPIFWMHHAFVDMLWELQQQRITREGRKEQYFYPRANDFEAYGVGQPETMIDHPSESFHYLTNPMLPFENLYNADGLRDTYRFFYHYTERPSCSRQNPTCGSPYLFCIDDVYMCAPKLQLGANCQEFESSDSCFEGICENGVCVKTPKCY